MVHFVWPLWAIGPCFERYLVHAHNSWSHYQTKAGIKLIKLAILVAGLMRSTHLIKALPSKKGYRCHPSPTCKTHTLINSWQFPRFFTLWTVIMWCLFFIFGTHMEQLKCSVGFDFYNYQNIYPVTLFQLVYI